jgi:uncharacterized membrane protein
MSDQPGMATSATSDDKLWAALSWVFTPLVPIIVMLLEEKKNRPYIKLHAVTSLAWGIVFYVVVTITSFFFVGLCILPLGLILTFYWAYKAYQGQAFSVPVISDFVKKQGWV